MMKKILFGLALFLVGGTAMAQFDASQLSIGLGGNYTMYKGDFGKNTPGVQLRVGYDISEKATAYLGFTYGFPIKEASVINYSDGMTSADVASTLKFKFKTITLNAQYSFIGTTEESFAMYGGAGASYVMVNYEETPDANPPAGMIAQDQVEKTNESGFTINLKLGAQYRTNRIAPFFDAGFSFPANQVNGMYVENVIPASINLNAGVRFYLGSK
jgi:outer membrane protein with beta-barrel domain